MGITEEGDLLKMWPCVCVCVCVGGGVMKLDRYLA